MGTSDIGIEPEHGGGIAQLKEQAVRGSRINRDGVEKIGSSKQGLTVEQESEAWKTRKT